MIWLQNLIIIIIGFLLSRILIEEEIHRHFFNSMFKKKNNSISYYTVKILFVSYFLSLFFPNTIVVITLLPIIKLIIEEVKINDIAENHQLTTNLVLALIYGSNIGGMGSMIGASSNIYFLGYIELLKMPGREKVSFFPWLLFGIPITLVLLLISKFILDLGTKKINLSNKFNVIHRKIETRAVKRFFTFLSLNIIFIIILSAIQYLIKPEKIVKGFNIIDIIFIIYISFFVFFVLIFPRGKFKKKRLFKNISEMYINLLLFPLIYYSELSNEIRERFNLARSDKSEKKLEKIYNIFWYFQFTEKKRNLKRKNNFAYISINRIFYDLPFLGVTFMGVVIFFLFLLLKIGDNPSTPEFDGVIFVFTKNLLHSIISENTSFTLFLTVLVFMSVFVTELISNTAIIIIMFSIITTIAPTLNIDPLFLMLAVTISSTATFMSPIASPVNAVAFASIKGVSLKQMIYKGLLLNILSIIWLILIFNVLNILQ